MTGRDRDEIYPDELANFCARGLSVILFIAACAVAMWRGASLPGLAEVAIGALLLLGPVVHPWYALWMVPLVAVGASRAWLVFVALLPLGYVPLGEFLRTGIWQDPIWTRVCEHGLCWLLLGFALRSATIGENR